MTREEVMTTRVLVRVTPQMLTSLMTAQKVGAAPRWIKIVRHGLPEDTRLVHAFYDPQSNDIVLVIESEHFEVPTDAERHPNGLRYLPLPELQVHYPGTGDGVFTKETP